MNEALDMERERINVVIVERLESVRLCVTVDPKDAREDLIVRFKPEDADWKFYQMVDEGDYLYLHYNKLSYPAM